MRERTTATARHLARALLFRGDLAERVAGTFPPAAVADPVVREVLEGLLEWGVVPAPLLSPAARALVVELADEWLPEPPSPTRIAREVFCLAEQLRDVHTAATLHELVTTASTPDEEAVALRRLQEFHRRRRRRGSDPPTGWPPRRVGGRPEAPLDDRETTGPTGE